MGQDSKAYNAEHDCLVQVAQVLKSNGADGELVLSFRDIDPEDITIDEPVFIDFDELPVPYFISNPIQRGNNKLIVHLTDIDSFEDAEELVGKAVYVKEDTLGDLEYEEGDFSFLIDWNLMDTNLGLVGQIIDFENIPGNPCIEVETKNGAAMIPLHDNLIVSVDPENQILTMSIPDGLI